MDWENFFTHYNIDYVTRGPNVKKDNVNIACPYCGDDPSHHMGVSLKGKGYGCWRAANHVGRSPVGLIHALLNCSWNQAKIIAEQYSAADPENLDEALASLEGTMQADKKPAKAKTLDFWPEFKPIMDHGSTWRFYKYLYDRGFAKTKDLIELYNLRCATTGKFKDRIIIPIYRNKKLISWTSRAIGKTRDAPRYLALSENETIGPSGLVNVFHSIWNYDELKHGGDILFVVEGPFDALKMDYYGARYNTCTTCTFGTAMSEEQAMLIIKASKRFKRTLLLYDEGATQAIFLAKDLLEPAGIECSFLPPHVDDPGEMRGHEVRNFICEYLK